MKDIVFIRHGRTLGNLQHRYIGISDEKLCTEGIAEVLALAPEYPHADAVICSPMKRCIQTAKLIYPENEPIIYNGLRECDFGEFEGKNYLELNGNPYYQKWIDSGGILPFPGGESREDFSKRCVSAFESAMSERIEKRISFVVHGGTIMAIMEALALPKKDYFDWQVKNCHGFLTRFDAEFLYLQGNL